MNTMEDKKPEQIEYKKCYEDEIDWASLEQLHDSTLKISDQCFEYKKLCVGIIGVIVAALLKIEDAEPISTIAKVCLIIGVGFWISDANAYFYQKANRNRMMEKIESIKIRNSVGQNQKEPIPQKNSWPRAFFNNSMFLYYYIITACIIALHL
ncbi:hypothetical protein [Aeromonas sobria]|uniref:hypothetical protein n=1 Tax=Aeromonas sobria TaxID=646 RepID=UPI0026E91DA9|nr:hypothetical protein [Aeromonas sobria]